MYEITQKIEKRMENLELERKRKLEYHIMREQKYHLQLIMKGKIKRKRSSGI